MIVIDTPEGIEAYRLLAIRGALKLETVGLRHSRGSALALVRAMGIKARTAKAALPLYETFLRERGILRDK